MSDEEMVMCKRRDLQRTMNSMSDSDKISFLLKQCEIEEVKGQKCLLDIQMKAHTDFTCWTFKCCENFTYMAYMEGELNALLQKVKMKEGTDRTIQDIVDTPQLVYNTFVSKRFGQDLYYGVLVNFISPFFTVVCDSWVISTC